MLDNPKMTANFIDCFDKKFTEAEDEAIRDGVAKIGAGNWSEIKSYYHIDLADRTAVQIKDRWRTLNK